MVSVSGKAPARWRGLTVYGSVLEDGLDCLVCITHAEKNHTAKLRPRAL